MEQDDLMKALVQVKRIGNLLNEVLDISQQLAEALDRNDQVSEKNFIFYSSPSFSDSRLISSRYICKSSDSISILNTGNITSSI